MNAQALRFILRMLAQLLPYALPSYGALTLAESYTEYKFGVAEKLILSLVATPFQILLKRAIQALLIKRDAQRLGARPVPLLPSERVGGIDILQKMLYEVEHGYIATHLTSFFERMGQTFRMALLGDEQIVTIEPDYIKRVLATEFKNFEKGRRFREATNSVLGVGVFNADDEMWKFHRMMTRPFFSRERISDFETFGRHADIAISKLKARFNEPGNPAMDFQDIVSRFTLDSATEFLFGSCVHSLNADLPHPHSAAQPPEKLHPSDAFARAFGSAQFRIALRTRLGYIWPLFELRRDETKQNMKLILDFINPIVDKALQNRKIEKEGGQQKEKAPEEEGAMISVPEGDTLLSHLVKETTDKKIITDETLNMLVAGRDTTASLLTFVVYMLSMHPNVMKKLREEILEHVGPSRHPTYDDIRSMKYLRAVLNETLRLFPPVPFDVRSTREATVWPSTTPGEKPFYIPKDTQVIYSAFIMHRWKPFWGPDALEFDPDRFIDERLGKYLTPNPFIFLPFNAGPRICLGQQFAYNESSFFLIRLLQSFSSFSLAKDAQPPESQPPAEWKTRSGRAGIEQIFLMSHLTMYSRGGLWVRMTESKETEVA